MQWNKKTRLTLPIMTAGDIVPCCQVEDCGAPLIYPNDRIYLWVRKQPDQIGEQIVVCCNCAEKFK